MGYRELDLPEDQYPFEKEKEINLSRGDLNFLTPDYVIEAAYDAMKEGFTHYIYRFGKSTVHRSKQGLSELQESVCSYYSTYGANYEPNEVLVTNGSASALYLIFAEYAKAGKVVLTDPTYPGYLRNLSYLNVDYSVATQKDDGFRLDADALREAVTPKTKLMVICNPLNPTGTVYTEKELREVADIAIENDLVVLSDEIYEKFIWDGGEHFALSSIEGMKERTLKRAGAAALRTLNCHDIWGPPTHIELWRRELYRRLNHMRDALNEFEGVECRFPESTFYLWPDFSGLGLSSDDIQKLLEKKRVMVDPGTKYGPSCDGRVRIGMVQPYYYIEEAAKRIKEALFSL
jgi:aspartate/methionine/tyrosine aminotransferase